MTKSSIVHVSGLALGVLSATLSIFSIAPPAPLQWPLFFWLLGSSTWLLGPHEAPALAAMYAGSVPLMVMMLGIVYSVFIATGPTMAFVPIVFVAPSLHSSCRCSARLMRGSVAAACWSLWPALSRSRASDVGRLVMVRASHVPIRSSMLSMPT